MTDSNEMTTKINKGKAALLIHNRRGNESWSGHLQGSDKIVIHRDNQNYTITYDELLDDLQPFVRDIGGDSRLVFTDKGTIKDIYKPSKRGKPTEIDVNNCTITLRDEDGKTIDYFHTNQTTDQSITIPSGLPDFRDLPELS